MTSVITCLLAALSLGDVFPVDQVIAIPEEARIGAEKEWTFYSFCTVNSSGTKVYFIEPEALTIVSATLPSAEVSTVAEHATTGSNVQFLTSGKTDELVPFGDIGPIRTTAKNGKRRYEVIAPVAVGKAEMELLLVSDAGSNRVVAFNQNDSVVFSFLRTGSVTPPNELRLLSNGDLLAAALKVDRTSPLNEGDFCVVFSRQGEILRSFAHTPAMALERNLWNGVTALLDVDGNDTVFLAFSVEAIPYVYAPDGRLLRKFAGPPQWFHPPEPQPAPVFSIEKEQRGFSRSWPRIIRLLYIGEGRIVLAAETNGRVEGVSAPFVLDVLSSDGTVLYSKISSDYLPVSKDSTGAIYWLSVTGDRLIKTRYEGGQR